MNDDLTIEEILEKEGWCALGFECDECPNKDNCQSLVEEDVCEWLKM